MLDVLFLTIHHPELAIPNQSAPLTGWRLSAIQEEQPYLLAIRPCSAVEEPDMPLSLTFVYLVTVDDSVSGRRP